MTIRATLGQVFGPGAAQNETVLVFQKAEGLTVEGIVAELVARLFSFSDFVFEAEDGAALTTEGGAVLRGAIRFELIELDRLPTQFRAGDRIDRFFIGFNDENI